MADQCHDGARKKAKYLHDAPNEALNPDNARMFGSSNGFRNGTSQNSHSAPETSSPSDSSSAMPAANPYQTMHPGMKSSRMLPPNQGIAPLNPPESQPTTMPSQMSSQQPSPLQQLIGGPMQPSTTLGNFQQPFANTFADPASDPSLFNLDLSEFNFGNHYGALEFGMLGSMSSGMQGNSMSPVQNSSVNQPTYGTQPYGRSHYAGQSLDSSSYYSFGGSDTSSSARGNTSTTQNMPYSNVDTPPSDYGERYRRNSHTLPPALSVGIGQNPFQGASPTSGSSADLLQSYDGTEGDMMNMTNTGAPFWQQALPQGREPSVTQQPQPVQQDHNHPRYSRRSRSSQIKRQDEEDPQSSGPSEAISKQLGALRFDQSNKSQAHQRENPTSIYSTVVKKYPYTAAFHRLTAILSKRFPPKKLIPIAKALGSIRPSLISLNRSLMDSDLIFMEKIFQRGLWDYEEILNMQSTPSIVCRRTGEIAHVGREFSFLTKWSPDVLLGRAPNLNTNTGGQHEDDRNEKDSVEASGAATATSSKGGHNTPIALHSGLPTSKLNSTSSNQRGDNDAPTEHRKGSKLAVSTDTGANTPMRAQPVFIAELFDDDSVVQFYEAYSKLAFLDSRALSLPCKLLKYKPSSESSNERSGGLKRGTSTGGFVEITDSKQRGGGKQRKEREQKLGRGPDSTATLKNGVPNSFGSSADDSKVECMYCMHIKRDVFNIPMMIVMNVSCCKRYCRLVLRSSIPSA